MSMLSILSWILMGILLFFYIRALVSGTGWIYLD
jgi:hypothetical protein